MTRSLDELLSKAGEFPGYTLDEVVHRGSKCTVARARRARDDCRVVLKIVTDADPESRPYAVLRHERAVANRVASDGIVRALGLEQWSGRVALVLEDFGGSSLRQYLDRNGKLLPEVFLDIAFQLCSALAEIHQHGIIHKDLKPDNMLINPAGVVKIADFSISSILSNEVTVPASARELEGTLPYMAPEQTGRMNRGLDQRADLYSLGITFYELLAGHRPFRQRDALELVHAHIASVPIPLHELDPGVPRALSIVVDKLLAKNPEDRYQSAVGLRTDIAECRRQLRERGRIADDFVPGTKDHPDTLQLPQKLYGRETETKTLVEAFERASEGKAQLLLVSGTAGVGKSALVNEVHKELTRRRGLFVTGKFDQLTRNTPFAPVAQAMRELVRQILSEEPQALAVWKTTLENAMAGNGGVLTHLIPELSLVMGPQPSVRELGAAEAQNRFTLVFQNFIRVFADEQHPLVIFLDDLQWVDPASLRLLQLLLTDPRSGYLLVIGAYRDNEVPPTHPLALAIGELRRQGAAVAEVGVGPLDLGNVSRLVFDALSSDSKETAKLAEYLFAKTHGNPFFVNQFLRSLRKEKLLTRDAASGRWMWNLEDIERARVTDNVVEFMAARLRQLAPETQAILRLAACIGYQFDVRTLSVIREASIGDTADALWEALREGFVLPLSADYRFLHSPDHDHSDPAVSTGSTFHVGYKFLHDRVQQAAYSLIEDAQKQAVHLRIGRILLGKCTGGVPRDEELFDVVNHLNVGASCIEDGEERLRLARLNLQAGRKAKSATAYDAAADYLRTGMWLLEKCGAHAESDGGWDIDYELAFGLHLSRAECEHLTGRFGQAERLFDVISSRVKTDRERAQVQNLRMVLCLTLGKYAEAVAAGRAGLKLFGIELPENPDELRAALDAELAQVDATLGGRPIADLIDTPALTDPRIQTISSLMSTVTPAAYFVNPTLFGLLGAKQVNLALLHGHNNVSAYGYVAYGMFLTGVLGRYREAYQFGVLGLALNDKFANNELTCKVNVLFTAFMNFFGMPLRTGHQPLSRAYAAGMQTGDFVYLSYACDQMLFIRLGAGDELAMVREEIDKFLELMHRTKHALSIELQKIMLQMVKNLQGFTKGRYTLSDAGFEEAGYVEGLLASGLGFAASWYYVVKLMLLYLHGDYAGAFAVGLEAQKRIGTGGVYFATELPFFLGLTCTALHDGATDEERETQRTMLGPIETKLKLWAEECPENFRHKHLMVAAELARIQGRDEAAQKLYESAIIAAQDAGFVHHEAMAGELLAKFHHAHGRRAEAARTLDEARRAYERWGATAKVDDLEDMP
ncbi:serine/threonine-protein kinase PknK [Pendulispora brunnea]|uniref:Serine/threonine-protein kinase PknK n=1 Tax=Pendulispora brunnea TaxID=2905690 RepID=A0ABZ2JZQ0_9BACT